MSEYRVEVSGRRSVAYLGSRRVGVLEWDRDLVVTRIDVTPQHRRRGVATALWSETAWRRLMRGLAAVEHSPTRTRDGEAWVRSLPGPRCEAHYDNISSAELARTS